MTELKPCPFCGTAPELMEGHRNHWRVECPRCGVRRAQFANGGVEEDKARAVRSWNTRAAINAMPDTVRIAELEEALAKCRDKFAEYAELHRQKLGSQRPKDQAQFNIILRKVERNREMADLCSTALARTTLEATKQGAGSND